MTIKRWNLSVKNTRRLIKKPAHKRLRDCLYASWFKRYKSKRIAKK